MGQVTVRVTLTNARELVMARLGHLAPEAVHTCEVEARVDTGTLRSVLPPPVVVERRRLIRLARSETQMTDGRWGAADVTHVLEPLTTPITNHPQRICDEGIRAAC